jgi:hypothetical protein
LLVQRIDLSDGFEDGQLGADLTDRAPKCPGCARPVNPKRHRCIFCDAARARQAPAEPPEPPEMVTCAVCGEVIRKQDSSKSAKGSVCSRCVWKVPATDGEGPGERAATDGEGARG